MDYQFLLSSKLSQQWKKIGTEKRSGVAVPLFSIYSTNSAGIGEFCDLKILARWCKDCGFSIIQLLPMNDLGDDFSPYNSSSSFALEPTYLSLTHLEDFKRWSFRKEISEIKNKYSGKSERVNYDIKKEKLNLLKKIFESRQGIENKKFEKYLEENKNWFRDYALFKVLKEKNEFRNWEEWEAIYKERNSEALLEFELQNGNEINFYYWIQWQVYEQFKNIKKYLAKKEILLLGDVPFLVSRDSADVWANQKYFKLNLSSGAPPDMYFANGQRWGTPPYNWEEIEKDGFIYLKDKLKYAENFYDMFRIDHFVGLLRVWTITTDTSLETEGLYGRFDPENESLWEEHAKKILDVIANSTAMLPCAEDLGTVPPQSGKILEEYGIPGVDVQRWKKNWDGDNEFIRSADYRANAVSVISTHDSSFLPVWWKYEAGTADETLFKRLCEQTNITGDQYKEVLSGLFEPVNNQDGRLTWKNDVVNVDNLLNILQRSRNDVYGIVKMYLETYGEKEKFLKCIGLEKTKQSTIGFFEKCFEEINNSKSVFSVQQIFEYMYLDKKFLEKHLDWDYRINFPGTISKSNWSLRLPLSLEELKKAGISATIKELNTRTGRLPKK